MPLLRSPEISWVASLLIALRSCFQIFRARAATPMTVTAEQAETNAQQWLNANLPGTTVGEGEPFYGYYHVMVLSAGKGYSMLSVNGYTGQVWYHNWHGTFVQEVEL